MTRSTTAVAARAPAADDAWSGAAGARVQLVNRDTVVNRVGVVVGATGCERGLHQDNASSCSIRWALCLPDTTTGDCSAPLTHSQLFGVGVSDVIVDVWLENHVVASPLGAGVARPLAALALAPNASSSIRTYGDDDDDGDDDLDDATFFNPRVAPREDGYFATDLSAVVSAVDGLADFARTKIADADGAYAWRGAYGSRVTLRGADDLLSRGAQNVTVRISAFLHETSGARVPSEGCLPLSRVRNDVSRRFGMACVCQDLVCQQLKGRAARKSS